MDQFFSHENHACPPSLSQGGKLRLGSKADIMPCLEVETAASEASHLVDSKFLDGDAVVQMLNPGTARPSWTMQSKCVRRRVVPSAAITNNWMDFLRVDDSKKELFSFLSHLGPRL